MLLYPLRGAMLVWLVLMAGVSVLFHGLAQVNGLFGLVAGAIWWLMAFKLASEALTMAASGREGEAGYEQFASDGIAVRQIFLGLGLMALGWIAWMLGGRAGLVLYCTALALVLPAIVILLVMEDSLLRAFDPRF